MPAIKKLAKDEPLVCMAYQNGATIRTIAYVFDVAYGTVRNTLIRRNITLRSRGRRLKEKKDENQPTL